MNIARSSGKMTIANAANAIVTFAGITYFARTLGAKGIGVFFLFEALLNILLLPADFGIRSAAEKRLSEGDSPGSVLTTSFLLKSIVLAIISGGILLFRGPINNYIGTNVAAWLVVAVVTRELARQAIQVLNGELRVEKGIAPWLSQSVIWTGFGAVLVWLGFGTQGLIYGLITGYAVSFIWAMHRRSTPFGSPSWVHARSLFDYSKFSFVSHIGGILYSWMDVLVIGYFLTSAHVGAYEVAWRITLVVLLASKAIGETIFPAVSKWDAEKATERIENLIPWAMTPSLALAVPAFFGALLFSREVLTLIFGPEYSGAWLVLIVLMGGKAFEAVQDVIGRSLNAIDHPELAAWAAVVAIVLNLVLNVVLIMEYGIVGAAVATVLSLAAEVSICTVYLSRFLDIRLPWRELGWLVLSSISMALVLLGVRSVIPAETLPRLLLVILLGALVYSTFVLSFRPLRVKLTQSVQVTHSDGTT
jgi:O-antigen/teichoic acid export membrane protein